MKFLTRVDMDAVSAHSPSIPAGEIRATFLPEPMRLRVRIAKILRRLGCAPSDNYRAKVSNVVRADISWVVPRVAAVMKRFAVAAVVDSLDAVAVAAWA